MVQLLPATVCQIFQVCLLSATVGQVGLLLLTPATVCRIFQQCLLSATVSQVGPLCLALSMPTEIHHLPLTHLEVLHAPLGSRLRQQPLMQLQMS